jgi:hypothetical protein
MNKAAVSLGHARNRFQRLSRSMAPETSRCLSWRRAPWLAQALCAAAKLGIAVQLGEPCAVRRRGGGSDRFAPKGDHSAEALASFKVLKQRRDGRFARPALGLGGALEPARQIEVRTSNHAQ